MRTKRNTITLTETELKKVISESVAQILKEIYDYEDEDTQYTLVVFGYNIETNKTTDYTGMDNNGDVFYDVEEALNTIKHMLKYPQHSDMYDIRYANNSIPLIGIMDEDYNLYCNTLFMSKIDKEYLQKIQSLTYDLKIEAI